MKYFLFLSLLFIGSCSENNENKNTFENKGTIKVIGGKDIEYNIPYTCSNCAEYFDDFEKFKQMITFFIYKTKIKLLHDESFKPLKVKIELKDASLLNFKYLNNTPIDGLTSINFDLDYTSYEFDKSQLKFVEKENNISILNYIVGQEMNDSLIDNIQHQPTKLVNDKFEPGFMVFDNSNNNVIIIFITKDLEFYLKTNIDLTNSGSQLIFCFNDNSKGISICPEFKINSTNYDLNDPLQGNTYLLKPDSEIVSSLFNYPISSCQLNIPCNKSIEFRIPKNQSNYFTQQKY